jgi:hypothetical protein
MKLPRFGHPLPNPFPGGNLPSGAIVDPFTYSNELLILDDHPFQLTNDLAMTVGGAYTSMLLHHYDGTLFYVSAVVRSPPGDSSIYINDADPAATALEAQTYLLAKFAFLENLVATSAIDPEEWPWHVTAELYTGEMPRGGPGPSPVPPAGTPLVNQPALRFWRGEPVGVGNLPDRALNILGIPSGQIEGTFTDLIGNYGTIFDPGQDGAAALAVRWGKSRGVVPIEYSIDHDHTPIDPYTAVPPVG